MSLPHWLRYIGTFLIVLSLLYPLRKYKFIKWGSMKYWLFGHEYLALIGSSLVVFHGFSFQFHAALPILTLITFITANFSGLLFELSYSLIKLSTKTGKMVQEIHRHSTILLLGLLGVHVVSAFYYGGF